MKAKLCKTSISVATVNHLLFKEGAIDNKTKVNPETFDAVANEVNSNIKSIYNIKDDLVFKSPTGFSRVNPQAVDKILIKKLGPGTEKLFRGSYNYGTDKVIMYKAVDAITKLMPKNSVKVLSSDEIKELYGDKRASAKGFILGDNTIVINEDLFNADTPFHEYTHFVLAFLKESDRALYDGMMKKALSHHTRHQVQISNPELSEAELAEEIFTTQIGLRSVVHFTKDLTILEKIQNFFKSMLNKLFGITVHDISLDDSLDSILDKFSKSIVNFGNPFINSLSAVQIDNIFNRVAEMDANDVRNTLIEKGLIKRAGNNIYYYGINGKISEIYKEALKHNSKEDAEQIYLEHMAKFIDIKYSASQVSPEDALKNIDDISDSFLQTPRGYQDPSGVVLHRVTDFYTKGAKHDGKGLIPSFDIDKAAEYSASAELRRSFEDDFYKDSANDNLSNVEKEEKAKEYAQTKLQDVRDNGTFQLYVSKYLDMFKNQTTTGTVMHHLGDKFIMARQLFFQAKRHNEKNPGSPIAYRIGPNGKVTKVTRPKNVGYEYFIEMKDYSTDGNNSAYITSMNQFITIYATQKHNIKLDSGKTLHDGSKKFSAKKLKSRIDYYTQLNKSLKDFESKHKNNILYRTEARSGNSILGYGGTADVVALEEGTNKLTIIDHKTKRYNPSSPGKNMRNWNHTFGPRLSGEFSEYHDNAHTKASIQTSLYRLNYEAQGYDVNSDALVFFTEGTMTDAEERARGDFGELRNVKITTITLTDMRQNILDEFSEKGIKVDRLHNTAKDDIHETLMKLFDGTDSDTFDLSDHTIKSIASSLNSKEYHTRGGESYYGFKYMNEVYAYPQGYETASLEKRMKYIKGVANNQTRLLKEESQLIDYFNNPDNIANPRKKANFEARLSMVDSSTHEVVRLSKHGAFGKNYAGILLFKNKLTGEHTVMILHAAGNTTQLRLGRGNKLIYGGLHSDADVRRKILTDRNGLKATKQNMKKMKVMAVLAKLKSIDPEFKVEYVVDSGIIGKTPTHTPVNFQEAMNEVDLLLELADNKGKLPASMQELRKIRDIFRPEEYGGSAMEQLITFIESRTRLKGLYSVAGDAIEEYKNSPTSDVADVLSAIIAIRQQETTALSSEEKRLLDKIIGNLQGLNIAAINQDIETIEKYSEIPQHFQSTIIQEMQSVARKNKFRAFGEVSVEMQKNANNAKKFLGTKNPLRVGTSDKYKNLFRPMNPNNPKDYYRLKPMSEMTVEEREFVTKWKEQMRKAMIKNLNGNKEAIKKVDKYLDEGYVPLIYPGFGKILANSKDKLKTMQKATESKIRTGNSQNSLWELKFGFNSEFLFENVDGIQFSDYRKQQLNINDAGVVEGNAVFEMDLESILNRVMSEASLVKYGNFTLSAAKALTAEAKRQTFQMDAKNDNILDTIDSLIRIGVKGHIDKSMAEKAAGYTGTAATYATIAFSPKSITIEGITNVANTTKMMLQESVMNRMFGVRSRFGVSDLAGAALRISTEPKKTRAIMINFGITEPDPKQLERFLSMTKKNKVFKEDNMFGMQELFLSLAQTEIVIASMLKDGSYDAYTVDENGFLHYDYKKDKRFYNDGIHTPEGKEKQKVFRKRILGMLESEGKMRGKDKYALGYTDLELQAMKDYVVEAFSSMDDDSKNPAMYAFFGKLQGKYRTWILPRVARMFGKSSQKRMANFNWKYVTDEDGKVIDVRPEFGFAEGYLWTIGRILNAGRSSLMNGTEFSDFSDFEKEQISKFLSDTIMAMLMYSLAASLKCDKKNKKDCWQNTEFGKLLLSALVASPGDIFVLISLYDVTMGSGSTMFPGLAALSRSVQNLVLAGVYAVEGDPEAAKAKAKQVIVAANYIFKLTETDRDKLLRQNNLK